MLNAMVTIIFEIYNTLSVVSIEFDNLYIFHQLQSQSTVPIDRCQDSSVIEVWYQIDFMELDVEMVTIIFEFSHPSRSVC